MCTYSGWVTRPLRMMICNASDSIAVWCTVRTVAANDATEQCRRTTKKGNRSDVCCVQTGKTEICLINAFNIGTELRGAEKEGRTLEYSVVEVEEKRVVREGVFNTAMRNTERVALLMLSKPIARCPLGLIKTQMDYTGRSRSSLLRGQTDGSPDSRSVARAYIQNTIGWFASF